MQYAVDPVPNAGYLSDGDATGESLNLAHLEGHQWNQLDDGTIEVTDHLPKKEYYMSLRRFNQINAPHRLGSISSGSGLIGPTNGTLGGTIQPSCTSPRSRGTLRGRLNTSIVDFKPSGKSVDCTVVMLDGTTREFRLDKAAYGQQLFDSVCTHLGILEMEFFGITYYDATKTWFWLHLDQKIAKQLGKNEWQFEFQVKFYPSDIDGIKEDLTRYYLCLQVRQDLISGQLPCSFMTYCLLGAYTIQSEAGDHDPEHHVGVKYIQDHPFAPSLLQTTEMLERIVQLHKLHRGKSPEEADRLFLNNARCLALYGVDLHKVRNSHDKDMNLGVFHGGILLYQNRVRLMLISWPRIISLKHRGRHFSLSLRPGETEPMDKSMSLKCVNATWATRLYTTCVEHHAFFRLRGSGRPKKHSLFPSFSTRKYHYPGTMLQTSNLYGGPGTVAPRSLANFRPIPGHPNDATWFTMAGRSSDAAHLNGAVASQYQYQPAMLDNDMMNPVCLDGQPLSNGTRAFSGPQRYLSPTGFGNPASMTNDLFLQHPPVSRPRFELEHWRISPADRTAGLGIDTRGLDVAAQPGAGWQGCRANKGVKAPGAYYYEASCLEDGLVRIGWSTNDANLELGSDNYGFGFGSDALGAAGSAGAGRTMYKGSGHDYGVMVRQGDVVGCLLDLDKGSVSWSHNGKVFERAFTIPDQLRGESFLPAASLKDSRILFNFGDVALEFAPDGPFIPVVHAADDCQVPNRNTGWRLNPYDASAGMDIAPDGTMAQSQLAQGWQGCRANQGIRGTGRFYFECYSMEALGLCRVGWSTEEGSLILGSDRFGFGYGADNEGFGLNGQQGKRMHCDEIENYGEAFTKDDVIGCFLDTVEHTIKWSKNGADFGDAYCIPSDLLTAGSPTLFPAVALMNSTVEFNFGDKPFQFYPGPDWTPVCCAPSVSVRRSRRKGPERKVKGWSYIDPSVLEPAMHQQLKLNQPAPRAVDRHEDHHHQSLGRALATSSHLDTEQPSTHNSSVRQLPPGAVPMPGMAPMLGQSPGDSQRFQFSPPSRQHPTSVNGVANGSKLNDSASIKSPPILNISAPRGSLSSTPTESTTALEATTEYSVSPLSRRVVNGEVVSVHHSQPQTATETFYDENGKLVRRTVRRSEVTTTKTISERIIRGFPADSELAGDQFDQALNKALLEVTKLDRDVAVLNSNVNNVELRPNQQGTTV